jgi:hypothetical protein
VQSHSTDRSKEDKPTTTAVTSVASGTSIHEEDLESHEKPHPSKISTSSVDPVLEDAPLKPAQFVGCDGCDRWWTVMDEPIYTCADCVGQTQLDQKCYDLLMKDQLKTRGFKCKKTHTFIQIPSWDSARFKDMPKDYLPVPTNVSRDTKWISPDEWKATLRELYLPE